MAEGGRARLVRSIYEPGKSLREEKEEMNREWKILVGALVLAVLLSITAGCGIRSWSASTEATYEVSPDGKKITYESNKEMQGLILEVTEVEGKINTVKISVDKSSTSEAAINAALQSQLNLQMQLMRLIDQLAPLAAAAAKAGT
jgi:hypothetical protein